jgi:hypothetical protein
MLTPEQARERLAAFGSPDTPQDRLKGVISLGGVLSAAGQLILKAGPEWEKLGKSPQHWEKAEELANALLLQKISPAERQKLFAALFPSISGAVEAAWNLFDRLPYQSGMARRPFRNPHHPTTIRARLKWVTHLAQTVPGYGCDVVWYAAWAPYLGYGVADTLGYLFAGAINAGGKTGQEVFDVLVASADGSHAIGVMGRHVVRGLLCAGREDGWEFIERMLLAAQREEGLRQVILESVDEADPRAFRRLLGVILDHNLGRFSAAVRAFNVWFGLSFEAAPPRAVPEILSKLLLYLDRPDARDEAIANGAAQDVYFALWALAFEDVMAALPRAVELTRSPDVERRFVATHLLAQALLKGAADALLNALDDEDLRVAGRAMNALLGWDHRGEYLVNSDLFERLQRLIARLHHKQNTLKPIVWDWFAVSINRDDLLRGMGANLGARSPKLLLPYLALMDPGLRHSTANLLGGLGPQDAEARRVLFELAGDLSPMVRECAIKALHDTRLSAAETLELEALLTRQAEDLRRGVIGLLLEQPNQAVQASAARLIGEKNEAQRRAGLELLRECVQNKRDGDRCRQLAAGFARGAAPSESEARLLDEILAENIKQVTLDNVLGLMDPHNRTQPVPPAAERGLFSMFRKGKLGTPAAAACLKALDDLIEAHRTDPVEIAYGENRRTELLGNMQWGFREPDPSQPHEQDLERLPLRDLWQQWYASRPAELKDADGMELIRASALAGLYSSRWLGNHKEIGEIEKQNQKLFDVTLDFNLRYLRLVQSILHWLQCAYPIPGEADFLIAALEDSLSRIPHAQLVGQHELDGAQYRTLPENLLIYLDIARQMREFRPEAWTPAHHARLWQLVRWLDEPCPGIPRARPDLEDALFAFQGGAATRDDLLDFMLGPRVFQRMFRVFRLFHDLSGQHLPAKFRPYPILRELVDACRERIISIETRRGDLPTAATEPAQAIRSVPGMRSLFRLLAALGKQDIVRDALGQSRQATLSHLIRACYPLEADTPEAFAAQASAAGFSERRLIELAAFAPHWARHVECTLGWEKAAEAVFWVYAHTKDRQWGVEEELREQWAAQVSEYTPLTADSLMDGAVDVAWFHKIYAVLGEARWNEVYRAAALCASGAGHTRARIFADAMLGKVSSEELIERSMKKRHQDSVRALGLIPLPREDGARQAEVLRRHECLQEFLRTSKKFGSQRQASEKLAVAIGVENLARTAGYADPQRLEWAMEIEAVRDLADGPVQAEAEGVTLSLAIDDLGEPRLEAIKNGKVLKAIPPAVKKQAPIAALAARKQQLDRQVGRMRASLEQAMCRGDEFTAAEIGGLFRHPMLRALLQQLIFTGPAGMGYPIEAGAVLLTHSGRLVRLAPADRLRIAHPVDLLASGEWHLWQHECFVSERIQPFKQVYRELYVLTATETAEGHLTRRYAGQQVNPRQALALFGGRGWVVAPEEGVHKTFHALGISARVGFLQDMFTPAEVEGLTLETVVFTRRGEWTPLPLDQIPARVFSEVMRDLDLVVSVAHAGGVDPEASASSIESRAALIRETCALLKIQNVEIKANHALVAGKLGNYTVHLGSAVVHRQPGGALCIVPVHAQQRGRLFLPFVEGDPKTAEVLSKVLLLARDQEIKDPTILEQILRG